MTGRLAQKSERTREALLAAATEVFAAEGYEAARLDDVTARAGVTKGALYHHFPGKAELFAAVFERLEGSLAARSAAEATARPGDAVDMLKCGMLAFLDACAEPAVRRIVLIDGLPVLGWERWEELGQRHNLGMVEQALRAAMREGLIAEGPVRPLAHLLQGALTQAGMALARAEDEQEARASTAAYVEALCDGLRLTRA